VPMLSEYELRVLREIEADLEKRPQSARRSWRTHRRLGWVGGVVWTGMIVVLGAFAGALAAVVAAATSLVVLVGAAPPVRRRITARRRPRR
jgi:DUF3040 family protein